MIIWFIKIFIYFSYSSAVYSFQLFFITTACTMSIPFLSFIVTIFGQDVHLIVPIFLKRYLVSPLLLFSSIFKHCTLKKTFFSLFAILWNSVFSWIYFSLSPLLSASLPPSAICKAFSENHFSFCFSFSFGLFCLLLPVQYYRPPFIILQAHCLLDLIPWIYSPPALHIHRGFDLRYTWVV